MLRHLFFPLLWNISPKLYPVSGLEKLEDGAWKSLDNDPYFIVKSHLFKVLSGWVSIRVKILSDDIMTPKLYFDFGEGYSEARTVTLYQIDESTYQADVMLPKPPKSIRFDPAEELCTFELPLFQIRAHSEMFHILHQFTFIMKDDYKNGTDVLRIIKKSYARYKKDALNGMLERLDKEYSKLHPVKKKRVTSKYVEYLNWIRKNEKNKYEVFNENLFSSTPLISIIMPVYNTPVKYLKKAIDSVIKQSYPHWELCIADDASEDQDMIELLHEYMQKNEKIHVCFREENGKVSMASNSALALAQGEYVTFLDHDDMLARNALSEMVKVINIKSNVKFIYSDEDKIDEKGRRFDPHFKSDWNPDMFLSQNYISHLSLVKKSTLDEVGHFRTGYEGAQDYDLFLRLTKGLKDEEIVHIEKVLYHWRLNISAATLGTLHKEYTREAGLKALRDFFSDKDKHMHIQVEEGIAPCTYKVNYPLPQKQPLVTLLIPTRDGYDILSKCVESILEKTIYENYEIIILDNQTSDRETLKYFAFLTKHYSHIRILQYNKPFNYSAMNNLGVKHAKGEIIGLINNDVEVISDHWLGEMVQHAIRPEIGAVGAMLYYGNDTIQHAGVVLVGGLAGHSHKHFKRDSSGYFYRLQIIQNYSAVTAACLLLRKELYLKVGGLDEEHLTVAFNDVDLCLKLGKKGYRNLWTPYVELYHHESVSRGAEDTVEKIARAKKEVLYMQKKWFSEIEADLYYNSNLTNKYENFGININD